MQSLIRPQGLEKNAKLITVGPTSIPDFRVYYKRVMVQYLCTYNSTFKLMFNIAAAGKLSRRASPVFEKKKESMQCSVADGCIGHWWTNTFETLLEERSLSMQQLELDLVPTLQMFCMQFLQMYVCDPNPQTTLSNFNSLKPVIKKRHFNAVFTVFQKGFLHVFVCNF